MKIARYLGRGRARLVANIGVSVAASALVVAAVASPGVPVTHVSANDGGIWLTNNSQAFFARLDYPVRQLNQEFGPPGGFNDPTYNLDVLQNGTTVLAWDKAKGDLYPVDVQAGDIAGKGVVLPGGPSASAALGGSVAAVLDPVNGSIWASQVGGAGSASLAGLDTAAKPQFVLKGAQAIAVGTDGYVYAASPTRLMTVPFTGSGFGKPQFTAIPNGNVASRISLTAVGDVPVVYEASQLRVVMPLAGVSATLPDASSTEPVSLQQPGPAQPEVLVATGTSLYSVSLTGGQTKLDFSTTRGIPAQPVVVGSCAEAAWASGTSPLVRMCAGYAIAHAALGYNPSASLVFRVNNGLVVLNNVKDGTAWAVTGKPQIIVYPSDYRQLAAAQNNNQHGNQTQTSTDQHNKPRVTPYNTEARTGRTSILHVLDGDSSSTGGPLAITSVSPAQGTGYQVQISPDAQTLALTLDSGVSSPVNFAYTVMDQRGATATASVTVTPTSAETPPFLKPGAVTPSYSIASTATGSYAVLGNWRDKENDPLALVNAQASTGTVTWTGDGIITFDAPSVTSDTPVTVNYTVSDGIQSSSGTLHLTVLGRGDTRGVAPVANPDVAQVVVGRPVSIQPLQNDQAGADPLNPAASLALAGPVAAPTGLQVSTNVANGQVQITAQQPGVYSLPYQDSFGSAPTATSQIMVVARAATNVASVPITSPESVLLHGSMPTLVNVLAGDYDPAGGLLTVVGVTPPPGVSASVVDGKWLRVQATTSNIIGWQPILYSVTNGTSDPVQGQLLAAWAPEPAPSPPVVQPISAVVRAGDEVNIPALANVSDPTGGSTFLLSGSAKVSPASLGTASVSGGVVRYAAPPTSQVKATEKAVVSFVVEDQAGEQTTGNATVTINPVKGVQDSAPVPQQVDQRVTAGATVTIPIPTTGVDPNGDSVTVTGIVGAPALGRVLSYSATSITYQAYPQSAGTDTFSYQVEDPFGMTGVAPIRIAVVPPALVPPPVATPVYVTAAPGAKVLVDVVSKAIVAPGDQVTIEPLNKTNNSIPSGFSIQGNAIEVTAPTGAQPTTINYGITDGFSQPSVATLTVRDQAGYVTPPITKDAYPPLPPHGQSFVVVHPLSYASDPTGSAADLKLVRVFQPDVKMVGTTLRIPLLSNPRLVTYEVRNPKGGTAVGVIHVPALVGPATVAVGVKPIQVPYNGSVTVNIDKYVADASGPVKLVSNAGVFATPASGIAPHPTSYTSLTLKAMAGYTGPADLTLEVESPPVSKKATAVTSEVSLPVQVGPPTPVINCPTTPIQIVQGGAPTSVDVPVECQVWTESPGAASSLSYSESWATQPSSVSFSAQDSGRTVVVTPGSSAKPGATGTLRISAPGAKPAELSVQVVAAPMPTMSTINVAGAKTGTTQTIDVAPYISSPLSAPQPQVLGVQESGGSTAATSFSGTTVQITPKPGAHGLATFTVTFTDLVAQKATRTATGTIALQVLDAPGAPSTALQGVVGNQQVALSWGAAPANGSPVDYYDVSMNGGSPVQVQGTSYTWTKLVNGTTYTFTVRAHNAVGPSTSSISGSFMPQSVPGAPGPVTATPGDGQVALSWGAANPNGRPVTYQLAVSPAPASGSASTLVSGTSYTWTGLDNNVGPYTFTVTPVNALGPGPEATSSAVYSFGVPPAPSAPTASGAVSPDQTTTTITVSWAPTQLCNDARPCTGYAVLEYRNGTLVQTQNVANAACPSGTGDCVSFGPLTNDGASYTYTLEQTNTEGKTSAASPPSAPAITAVGIPSQVTDLSVKAGNQQLSATFTLPASHGSALSAVNYTASNLTGGASVSGSWANPGTSGTSVTETIGGLVNGDNYAVTVEGCNEAGECGTASNTSSGMPYGPPYPPSVTANPSGSNITFGWSGGGNNGVPVKYYEVCIDGSCTQYGAPGSVTNLYGCSTTHSIYAYVIDNYGQQSGNSATVTASTQTCAPPNPPIVSASASGNTVAFSWSGGGGSGLPVSYYEVNINGGGYQQYSTSGSTSQAFGCGTTVSISAYVVDTIGQQSSVASASAATSACPAPPPSPSFTISWSANYSGWLAWSWSGFPAGNTSYSCVEGGVSYGPYTYTFSANGSIDNGQTCYDATKGESIYVVTNGGIKSNSITVP